MEFMFLPLKRYAEFSGRSRRMEFWMWILFQFLLGCIFLVGFLGLVGSAILAGGLERPEQFLASGCGETRMALRVSSARTIL